MNSVKINIISAMNICKMEKISEGGMYHALFSQGLDADDATMVVKELLEEGRILRSGCAFILQPNGKKNTTREQSVCNS